MNAANGFNPMRWNCEERGCFNKKRRPKIELFSDCFPGRISFGDVDALVEVNRQFLHLEWKSDHSKDIPRGQQILFERLTEDPRFTVLVVSGCAEQMTTTGFQIFWHGKGHGWVDGDIQTIRERIQAWSWYASKEGAA